MHDGLKSKVLIGCEVTNNVLDMAPRHHKCVTAEGGIAAEKRHVDTIVVEQLMLPARLAGQEAAYEAAANPDAPLAGSDVKGDSLGHNSAVLAIPRSSQRSIPQALRRLEAGQLLSLPHRRLGVWCGRTESS